MEVMKAVPEMGGRNFVVLPADNSCSCAAAARANKSLFQPSGFTHSAAVCTLQKKCNIGQEELSADTRSSAGGQIRWAAFCHIASMLPGSARDTGQKPCFIPGGSRKPACLLHVVFPG